MASILSFVADETVWENSILGMYCAVHKKGWKKFAGVGLGIYFTNEHNQFISQLGIAKKNSNE